MDVFFGLIQDKADVNYLNNSWRLPVEYKLNSMLNHFPVRDKYIVWMRPDIFYNSFDGMQFGVNFKADYLRLLHKIEGNVWMNSGLFQQKNYTNFDGNERLKIYACY